MKNNGKYEIDSDELVVDAIGVMLVWIDQELGDRDDAEHSAALSGKTLCRSLILEGTCKNIDEILEKNQNIALNNIEYMYVSLLTGE